MTLHLHNTLTRRKEAFAPLDPANVRMYVCGPTVYDRPHIGNARSVVVYDVLFRLLNHLYGAEHVTYARNITDVDDKINAAAQAAGEPISALTARVTQWFHDDMAALSTLPPTHEPRATVHIPVMIAMIEQLLERGHAYAAGGHVLFDVTSYAQYGQLSGRRLDDLLAGARVEVADYKKHPGDFVLWKPADPGDDPSSVFASPWGAGRPGWHIECSAMSSTYLGHSFDLHGGGADLMFPHHENEIAQSRCADEHSEFARLWVHNGFLTVNGEKMSKSLGNFITVRDLLDKGVKGEVIRFALLSTRYNEPLDWNEKLLHDAQKVMDRLYRALLPYALPNLSLQPQHIDTGVREALEDNLNTPRALALLQGLEGDVKSLLATGRLLGLLNEDPSAWFKGEADKDGHIQAAIDARNAAKQARNYTEADRIRKELAEQGILLEDKPGGVTEWRRG